MATVLYNDRINCFRRMRELDFLLDDKPTGRRVAELAELRIRSIQCFRELESFNDTGKFLCRHPLTAHRSERAVLEELYRDNPAGFLQKCSVAEREIKRYTRHLQDPKREDRRTLDKALLEKHKTTYELCTMIISAAKK
ncbi:MAG: hypothetical protein SPI35_05930 [Porphyromonas sp.]|nr:hypothetical protein [Porphyromonas sp.]